MSIPLALIQSMRPQQWVKNLFVLAPLVFAHRLGDPESVMRVLGAFGIFCLASSAVYLMNDILDREADRLHPTKRDRPIAAGSLPLPLAVVENAVRIAQDINDQAQAHYLLAMTLRQSGAGMQQPDRLARAFEAAISGGASFLSGGI